MSVHGYLVSAICLFSVLFPQNVTAQRVLAAPAHMLETAERIDFVGANVFTVEHSARGDMLRSTPRRSASGLYQKLDIDGHDLSSISWSWRVEKLQRSADLRKLATEDTGATVFFIFGEPSMFNRDVPTLAYEWSSTPVPDGTVMNSARYASLRYIQLHGAEEVGTWQNEKRNVAEDFRSAFKREPDVLRYIAVFNDNDQTRQACSALFGPIIDGH
jgi:hypothetical protein